MCHVLHRPNSFRRPSSGPNSGPNSRAFFLHKKPKHVTETCFNVSSRSKAFVWRRCISARRPFLFFCCIIPHLCRKVWRAREDEVVVGRRWQNLILVWTIYCGRLQSSSSLLQHGMLKLHDPMCALLWSLGFVTHRPSSKEHMRCLAKPREGNLHPLALKSKFSFSKLRKLFAPLWVREVRKLSQFCPSTISLQMSPLCGLGSGPPVFPIFDIWILRLWDLCHGEVVLCVGGSREPRLNSGICNW